MSDRDLEVPAPDALGPVPIERVEVAAYDIPTEDPEQDGTLEWDSTAMVVVEVTAGGRTGVGYTYEHPADETLVRDELADDVLGEDVLSPRQRWLDCVGAVRNMGRPGLAFYGIAALDTAIWDTAARVLGVPLVTLLGQARDEVPIYGSGGFTSYTIGRLQQQLSRWVDEGIPRVKMKTGRHPDEDVARLQAAREAIGDDTLLLVDANGAFTRKEALHWGEVYADFDVRWYEEPVASSEDVEGMRLLRDRAPARMEIAGGEYACTLTDVRALVEGGAVDCLQLDVTRCGGFTGFLDAAAVARSHLLEVSAHCAPQLAQHACAAITNLRHLEHFHDHVRIEQALLDGATTPDGGTITPRREVAGNGLTFKHADAAPYTV